MLLDTFRDIVSPLPSLKDEMPAFLDRIAEFVFQKLIVRNDNDAYRICEIEFYVLCDIHPDIFTHRAEQQQRFGLWYFHESGMDITFGDNDFWASFLIRGIRKEGAGERDRFISGPLRVMKELCNSTQTIDNGAINLLAEYEDTLPSTEWITNKRIGLNRDTVIKRHMEKSEKTPEELFFDKPYRYISWLEPFHGFRDRTRVLEDEYRSGASRDQIQKAFNYTPKFLK